MDDIAAVDDAILEDMVHCRYCGASYDVSEICLYGVVYDTSAGTRSGGVAICEDCADRDTGDLLVEVVRLRDALQTIREHYGQVCDEYEVCTHRACAASYGAWAVADEALAPDPAPPPPQKRALTGLYAPESLTARMQAQRTNRALRGALWKETRDE